MKSPARVAKGLRETETIFTPSLAAGEEGQNLHDLGSRQALPAGTELFQQGSSARSVYVIDFGLVKLVRVNRDGHEMIFGLPSSGWLLGATEAVLKKSHPFTAATLTFCYLHQIPVEDFLGRLKKNAQLSWYVHEALCREAFDQVASVEELRCSTARRRLERLLRQLIAALKPDHAGTGIRLKLPLKHWEIAELIAVTPEHLSRIFKQMQFEGIMRNEKGWVIVGDLQKLRRQTDGNGQYSERTSSNPCANVDFMPVT